MKNILLFANRVIFALMFERFSCPLLVIASNIALTRITILSPATQEMERI